jgi:hypothetical protein
MEVNRGLTPICSRNCRPKLEGLKDAVRRVGAENYLKVIQQAPRAWFQAQDRLR